MIWGMRPSQFVKLERDAHRMRREQIADRAKSIALGSSSDVDKNIREFLAGKFW
jgi:hypothetical protein